MIEDNKLAQMAELDDVELVRLIRAELDGKCDLDLSGLDPKDCAMDRSRQDAEVDGLIHGRARTHHTPVKESFIGG